MRGPKQRFRREAGGKILVPENGTVPEERGPHHDVLLTYLSQNEIAQSFHRSLIDMLGFDLMEGGARLKQWVNLRTGALNLVDSRNRCCELLLEDGKLEWLLTIDADMGFERDLLHRMLAVADPEKRPIIGALCFAMREIGQDGLGGMRTFPSPTIFNWTDIGQEDGHERMVGVDHYPANALIPAGATGGACLLIHRSVLEKLIAQFGTWFDRLPDPSGVGFQGEDISFFVRCRDLGIPLFIHTGIRTTHMKTVWLAETDFWSSRLVREPATETMELRLLRWGGTPGDQEAPDPFTSLAATTGLVQLETYPDPDPPWVLLAPRNVRFRPGWIDAAQDVARRYGAQVVGLNDLTDSGSRGESTQVVMVRRSYLAETGATWDGPGTLIAGCYSEGLWQDEIITAAKLRNVYQAALGAHVELLAAPARTAEQTAALEADARLFKARLRTALATTQNVPIRIEGLEPAEV